MNRHEIEVFPDGAGEPELYEVWAHSVEDARMIAFILDGGVEDGLQSLDPGHYELAKMYTRVIQ